MDSHWKPVQHLPKLARALEARYPGIAVSVEIEQYRDDQPFRRITFKGAHFDLRRHGLLTSSNNSYIDEYGSRVVPFDEGVYHFHGIYLGEEKGPWSSAQHPANAKTRNMVSRILAKAQGNSRGKTLAAMPPVR